VLRTGNLGKSRRGGPAVIASIPQAVVLEIRITLMRISFGTWGEIARGSSSGSRRESRSDGFSWVDSIRAGSLHKSWRGARITRIGSTLRKHVYTRRAHVP
jgi:hypothetical protein